MAGPGPSSDRHGLPARADPWAVDASNPQAVAAHRRQLEEMAAAGDRLARVTLDAWARAEGDAPPSGMRGLASGLPLAASMPLAARIAAAPERTAYGKIWNVDVAAIERSPFVDRPWLSRATAVIHKFRAPGGISIASLKAVGQALARLWYEGKGVCHHSWAYIARRAGVCRDTVRRALNWFRTHGLLTGLNVLVRTDSAPEESAAAEERIANVYFAKLPEEGPPELSLPTPESPAAKASVLEKIRAELSFIVRKCPGAQVTAWGIKIVRGARWKDRRAPA